jgi:hypothetical protein
VRIHLAGKHSLELELLDGATQVRDVRFDLDGRAFVSFFRREFDELPRVGQAARQAVEPDDDLLEFGAFPAEFLCAFGLIPNAGLF